MPCKQARKACKGSKGNRNSRECRQAMRCMRARRNSKCAVARRMCNTQCGNERQQKRNCAKTKRCQKIRCEMKTKCCDRATKQGRKDAPCCEAKKKWCGEKGDDGEEEEDEDKEESEKEEEDEEDEDEEKEEEEEEDADYGGDKLLQVQQQARRPNMCKEAKKECPDMAHNFAIKEQTNKSCRKAIRCMRAKLRRHCRVARGYCQRGSRRGCGKKAPKALQNSCRKAVSCQAKLCELKTNADKKARCEKALQNLEALSTKAEGKPDEEEEEEDDEGEPTQEELQEEQEEEAQDDVEEQAQGIEEPEEEIASPVIETKPATTLAPPVLPTKPEYPVVACEHVGHRTHKGCQMKQVGVCFGRVRYGHESRGWSKWVEVDGKFDCNNKFFGDPTPNQAKECQCDEVKATKPPPIMPTKPPMPPTKQPPMPPTKQPATTVAPPVLPTKPEYPVVACTG